MNLTLNDGSEIPQIGLGTWQLVGEEGYRVIREAITLGYRHLDTASAYGNENEVGRAVRDAVAAGDVTRDELFITTKVWRDEQGTRATQEACRRSLDRLGLDYLDLYLVHWPHAEQGQYVAAFESIARLQGLGLVQSVGVANFYEEVLREIIDEVGVVPATNQVELHPGFSQTPLRQVHADLGVTTVAWSPLGRGGVMAEPVLDRIAREVGATPAQVALRWAMDLGCVVIPKSAHPRRLQQNLEAGSITLSRDQILAISALDRSDHAGRLFDDPRCF
ncbi:aldo/keto reductase [Corynebacterium sp.]|uniref:aldo/keto reductase n=1 Tax=Corynebacterium sp. TaxID=1720 RepID=UPI0026DEB1C5|nr:aldo/keto reductase [Corynebacterium sp.]MDO5512441.1 aldo/keto reductase [Corynebacterium sp.]